MLDEDEYSRRKDYYMRVGARHYYFMNIGNGEVSAADVAAPQTSPPQPQNPQPQNPRSRIPMPLSHTLQPNTSPLPMIGAGH